MPAGLVKASDSSGDMRLPGEASHVPQAGKPINAGSRTAIAMETFMQAGYTKAQAAAITANLARESGLNSNASGDHGTAHGIAQWRGDRQAKFKELFGKDIHNSTYEDQLKFVAWELKHNEKGAGDKLLQHNNAYSAAGSLMANYERPAESLRPRERVERGQLAESIMKNYQPDDPNKKLLAAVQEQTQAIKEIKQTHNVSVNVQQPKQVSADTSRTGKSRTGK
jgi:hypothetical protein